MNAERAYLDWNATAPLLPEARAAIERSLDVHGNPNVLTRDVGTSRLGQGPTSQSCLVEVERYTGPPYAVRAFRPPDIIRRPAR